jgi:hypothetical protein
VIGGGYDLDWNSIAKRSQEAFRVGVNEWIGRARVQGGKVSGPAAILTPGSLVSDTNLETRIYQTLASSQVPLEISDTLARVLATAWKEWAAGFQIQLPRAYPSFAAFPGPVAPPTRAAQSASVSQGSSVGEASLKAPMLANKLSTALRMYAMKAGGGNPDQAMRSLANWVESSFTEWKNLAKLVGVMGKGPIPTFAPPYVPVGPVISGDNLSQGPVFAGPRFGKVVI